MAKPGNQSAGVSINFDAQALHDAEEAEYQREEQERNKELQQLLTTAFDDPLSDDEDEEDESGKDTASEGSDSGHEQVEDKLPNGPPPGWHGHMPQYPLYPLSHASTPLAGGLAPPLLTPATFQSSHNMQPTTANFFQVGVAPENYVFHQTPPMMHMPSSDVHYHEEEHFSPRHQEQEEHDEDENEEYHVDVQQNGDFQPASYQPSLSHPVTYLPPGTKINSNVNNNDHNEDYCVQYTGANRVRQASVERQGAIKGQGDDIDTTIRATAGEPQDEFPHDSDQHQDFKREVEKAQTDYLDQVLKRYGLSETDNSVSNEGPSVDGRRFSQLQILYNARGRKIDELEREINSVRDDCEREVRILKHKLALTQDERDGLSTSLEQSSKIISDKKNVEADMSGQLQALEAQVQSLKSSKEQILHKLHSAESTIESLNYQLKELESSESLSRAREHHESVVAGMQKKFDANIYSLTEKLDQASHEKMKMEEQISTLKKHIEEQERTSEKSHIYRAETINKLTESLEKSQNQCKQLLEAGAGQELSKLKIQLQEAIASKSISEDINSSLQDEIRDLKEQVNLYETMSRYEVYPSGSSNKGAMYSGDDSFAQLGIKKSSKIDAPKWSTPDSLMSPDMNHGEGTLTGLKSELERCLAMYRNKRQQVVQLQKDLHESKRCMDEQKRHIERSDKELNEARLKITELKNELSPLKSTGSSISEVRLKREKEALDKEKALLLLEIEDLNKKIEEIATSEEDTKNANRDLSAQMAQMVHDFDEDKKQALDRLETTLLKHQESVRKAMEEAIRNTTEKEKQEAIAEYEKQVKDFSKELSESQTKLQDVQSLYLEVCQAKDNLEGRLNDQWQERMKKELDNVRAELEIAHDRKLLEVEDATRKKAERDLTESIEKVKGEEEERMKKLLDTEIAIAKVSWTKEHQESLDEAVDKAVMTIENHWQHKWEEELEQELANRLDEVLSKIREQKKLAKAEWSKSQESAIDKELKRQIEKVREKWRSTELADAIAAERQKLEEFKENNPSSSVNKIYKSLPSFVQEFIRTAILSGLQEEHEQELEELAARMSEEHKKHLEEENNKFQHELDKLQELQVLTENKHKIQLKQLEEDREKLIASKNEEMKEAVRQAHERGETDLKTFLNEHQDTLNKALKSAKEELGKDKADMLAAHEKEMSDLREKLDQSKQSEVKSKQEYDQLKKENNKKIEELMKRHDEEKEDLMISHRENLYKALEEARIRWQKKYEEALIGKDPSCGCNLAEREQQWTTERNQLLAELRHQAELLSDAESEPEMLATRIKQELQEEHKKELEKLQSHLEDYYTKQAEEMKIKIEALQESQTTKLIIDKKLKEAECSLKAMQETHNYELSSIKTSLNEKQMEIKTLKQELAEVRAVVEAAYTQKEQAELRISEAYDKLEATTKEYEDLYAAHEELLQHSNENAEVYKRKEKEFNQKIVKLDHKLKQSEIDSERKVKESRERLELEHQETIEKLKSKMLELRSSQSAQLEAAQKQHAKDRHEMQEKVEELIKQQKALKQVAKLYNTQLEAKCDEEETTVADIRVHYMGVIHRMRAEIHEHVKASNMRAASTVKQEVLRERQATAKRLRRYYLNSLKTLLKEDLSGLEGMSSDEKIAYMERALTNIPDQDESKESTPVVSRSTLISLTSEGTPTPTESPYTPRSTASLPLYRSVDNPIQTSSPRLDNMDFNTQSYKAANERSPSRPRSNLMRSSSTTFLSNQQTPQSADLKIKKPILKGRNSAVGDGESIATRDLNFTSAPQKGLNEKRFYDVNLEFLSDSTVENALTRHHSETSLVTKMGEKSKNNFTSMNSIASDSFSPQPLYHGIYINKGPKHKAHLQTHPRSKSLVSHYREPAVSQKSYPFSGYTQETNSGSSRHTSVGDDEVFKGRTNQTSSGYRTDDNSHNGLQMNSTASAPHVSFKNEEDSVSDVESMSSTCSSDKFKHFRKTLKTNRAASTTSAKMDSKRPIRASGSDPTVSRKSAFSDVYRPTAMVTRQTQVPSPMPK